MWVHVALAGAWLLVGVMLATTFFLARDYLKPKDHRMPVIAAYQPLIDAVTAATAAVNAATAAIQASQANPTLPTGAADATDVTDTETALSTATGDLTTATSALTAAAEPPAS